MNITPWKQKAVDPFDQLLNFDSPHWGFSFLPVFDAATNASKKGFFPAIDATEEENQVIVSVDVPGLKKEDIRLSVDGSVLTISGERKIEEEKKNKNYYRLERSYGHFERRLDVGVNIDQSKVTAKVQDGVLKITIPKSSEFAKKVIQIEG